MAESIVLAELLVLGLAEAVVGEQLVSRSASRVADEVGDRLDVALVVVDTGDDRSSNDDLDLWKLGAEPPKVVENLVVANAGDAFVLVRVEALDVEEDSVREACGLPERVPLAEPRGFDQGQGSDRG